MNVLSELLNDPNAWAALVTLTALEIVLGIDNLVFISVLMSRLDRGEGAPRPADRPLARVHVPHHYAFRPDLADGPDRAGVTVFGMAISWHDIILIGGGLFLIAKATHEIHAEVEAREDDTSCHAPRSAFAWIVLQLVAVDLVFSLDSIITAIGMAQDMEVMIAAVVIAMIVMYVASGPVAAFIAKHPTTKMLALAFLVLIGVALVADGFEFHIPRGYIYFAMVFAGGVEVFNVMARRNRRRRSAGEDPA